MFVPLHLLFWLNGHWNAGSSRLKGWNCISGLDRADLAIFFMKTIALLMSCIRNIARQISAAVWTVCYQLSRTLCDEQTSHRTADGLQICTRVCSYKQISSHCSVMIVVKWIISCSAEQPQSRWRHMRVSFFSFFFFFLSSAGCLLFLGAPPTWWLMYFPACTCCHSCVCVCVHVCVCVCVCVTETDGSPRPVVYDTFHSPLAVLCYSLLSHKRLPTQTLRTECHASVSPQ